MSLSKAPFRLLSIVNRIDLWKSDEEGVAPIDAGEGRFVFVLQKDLKVQRRIVTFEMKLTYSVYRYF